MPFEIFGCTNMCKTIYQKYLTESGTRSAFMSIFQVYFSKKKYINWITKTTFNIKCLYCCTLSYINVANFWCSAINLEKIGKNLTKDIMPLLKHMCWNDT